MQNYLFDGLLKQLLCILVLYLIYMQQIVSLKTSNDLKIYTVNF